MRKLAPALAALALLLLPAAAEAKSHHLTIARAGIAVERQVAGFEASDCRAEDPFTVACHIVGPWEEEGEVGTVEATAIASIDHGRIYVIVDGFPGETSERL